jgi:hypothetical protein
MRSVRLDFGANSELFCAQTYLNRRLHHDTIALEEARDSRATNKRPQ